MQERKNSETGAKRYDHDPGDRTDVVVGFWKLTPAEWKRLRAAATDPESLCASYEKWREREQGRIDRCRQKGYRIVLRRLNLGDLLRWCAERGVANDAEARSRYGLERTIRMRQERERRARRRAGSSSRRKPARQGRAS